MKASSLYGAGRSRPQIRFLASAKDIVESQESDDLEIVLLPPESANQGIESDEEGNDNILNEECLPDQVSGISRNTRRSFRRRNYRKRIQAQCIA